MPKKSSLISLTVAAGTVLALTACSASGGSGGPGGSKPVVGFVTAGDTLPFYTSMQCGANKAAKKYGVTVRWQGTSSTDSSDEINTYNGVVSTNPDGMVLVPWDSEAFIQPVKSFLKTGKPIVTADGVLNKPVDLHNTSTDGVSAGAAVAEQLVADGLKGTVLVVTDAPANALQMARAKGFMDVMKKADGIKLLDLRYAGSDSTKAAGIVSSTIIGQPDLSLVVTTLGTLGQGAASAIEASGKKAAIQNVGWDADPASVKALKEGAFTGLISQSPEYMGYESIKTVAGLLKGTIKKSDLTYHTDSPSMYLTKDNIDSPKAKTFLYASSLSSCSK